MQPPSRDSQYNTVTHALEKARAQQLPDDDERGGEKRGGREGRRRVNEIYSLNPQLDPHDCFSVVVVFFVFFLFFAQRIKSNLVMYI